MGELPLKDYILPLLGGGLVGGLIQLLKLIAERRDQRKKEKKDDSGVHTDLQIRTRELDLKEGESITAAVWRIVDEKKTECDDLKTRLTECEKNNSLSHPTITKIYSKFRKLGREISRLEGKLNRGDSLEEIAKQIDVVKTCFDETEASLPGGNI